MANLFELLINKFQKQPQELQLVENTGEQAQVPELKLTSVSPATNYNAYNQPEAQPKAGLFNNIAGIGDKMQDGLFGKMVSAPDTVDTDNMSATVNAPVRQGGFLNDLSAGWQDNTQNGFKVDNLLPDENKTWATRLGEGLGTAARFVNSPLGRGIITGGIVAATGGNPLQTLVYGGQAGATNQNVVMKDKAYRQQLERQGVDTSGIRGYIDDNTYKQILNGEILKEQQAYRQMALNNQMIQNEIMNNLRKDQFDYEKQKNEENKILKREEMNYKKTNDDRNYDLKLKELETKSGNKKTQQEQGMKSINMINKALDTVKKNPKAFGYLQGALGSDISNRVFSEGTEARSIINSVAAEYRKYLTGAQMSDRERLDYEKFLPAPKDNAQIITSKLNSMLGVISAREGINGEMYNNNSSPKQIGKYKVTVVE